MKLAIVGVTGLVGSEVLKVLEERKLQIDELIPVASVRSKGKKISLNNSYWEVITIDEALEKKPNIAIFSAGSEVSKEYAPLFANNGTTVIDNSSFWRMDDSKKLVVPEINGHLINKEDKIIANPNCSTIQMVMALYPLHKAYKIKRIVVSTYQSVTGSGKKAVDQLMKERKGKKLNSEDMAYPHKIDMNAIPHIDVFQENGYSKEEMKMVSETQKILNDYTIKITSTTVRIPTIGGHSESINVEFEKEFNLEDVYSYLNDFKGIQVIDNLSKNEYPLCNYAHGKDDVFVGRIRRDESQPNTLNMWVVADNLRKGAATNAVQIAELFMLP